MSKAFLYVNYVMYYRSNTKNLSKKIQNRRPSDFQILCFFPDLNFYAAPFEHCKKLKDISA